MLWMLTWDWMVRNGMRITTSKHLRKYLHLIVNSNGVCYDSLGTGVGGADVGFDAGAEVKTATLADRWVLEVRLPTAALGTAIADGDVWKINVARNRHLYVTSAQGLDLDDVTVMRGGKRNQTRSQGESLAGDHRGTRQVRRPAMDPLLDSGGRQRPGFRRHGF